MEITLTKFRQIIALLAICVLAFMSVPVHSQSLRASLSHYSVENGLCSNTIGKLRQDNYGYVWIGTWNGVSRFDGYNFYNYNTGNTSQVPGLHNRVSDLYIDQQQNVWLQMYDHRLFVIDRRKDMIVNPFENIPDASEYRVTTPIFITTSGDVLAYVDDIGIYKLRLNQATGKFDTQLITTTGLKVTCMAEGYHDDIWVGTPKGVHRVDIGNLSIEREAQFEDEEITALYSNGFNVWVGCQSGRIKLFSYGQEPEALRDASSNGAILSIFVDSREGVWFSDDRTGASRLSPNTFKETHFEQRVLAPAYEGYGAEFNETDMVWVRMSHAGFGYYNWDTNEVEYFHNNPENPWNLSNTVNAALELPEGVIFESTSRHGLEKLEIQKNTIPRTRLVTEGNLTLGNEVRAMYYDTNRKLLLMGNKAGTLFVTGTNGRRQVITNDSKGQPLGRIYGISKDSKGNYWLCSKDNGLFRMTLQSGGGYSIVGFPHQDGDMWSPNSNSAYTAVEDKQGNIWIATYGGGVNVMTKNKDGQTVFLNPDNEMKAVYPRSSHRKVRTVAIDKEGTVWAGTTDGLLLMSYKNGKMNIEKVENSEEEPDKILMSNDIVCLTADNKGKMWVGTNGGGLSYTVGRDGKGRWLFETLTNHDGLPSEEIKAVAFDQQDNAWFTTDHIVCSYNQQRRILSTFSSLDGVDETACSEGAIITLPNKNILVGTLDGYYTIDIKKLINDNGSLLKLRITDFWLNDELQSPRLNDNFDFYVPDARSVKLPSHNDAFAFRFSAMNYQLQHRLHYQYKLEGYDHDWNNADKSRMATYKSLPTGTYRFRVKAFLLESPETYDMREIEVIVPPYFIFSNSAIWLYMILAVAVAIALMLWRQRQLSRKYGVTSGSEDNSGLLSWIGERLRGRLKQGKPKKTVETDDYELID